ncbi:MAG: hypothetical protein MI741_16665, partial [Rhodospirillales bacterium]|nr:hypothetical protein [Rhodospirillales bacterium]
VALDDPLALEEENTGKPVLLIGTYVRAVIEGAEVGPVAAVDRAFIRDGYKLWIMTPDDRLEIRTVEILYRGRENVLVAGGIESGERIVTSLIPAPVEGMGLRLQSSAATEKNGGPETGNASESDSKADRPEGQS